ncbi:MAG: shikimate kinase [Proteobacteria bacterium]|nr:shikimate kinase [Pseudomonadota bacterium]
MTDQQENNLYGDIGSRLPAGKFVVLVGLMGAGKTHIGKRLAVEINRPFVDSDDEIELAAGSTIPEIFKRFGEDYFRDGERRVIRRIFEGQPAVMATGGGAFMDAETRKLIAAKGISIWLRAEIDILVKRTSRRNDRPLLKNADSEVTLKQLMAKRYPVYAEADVIVDIVEESAAANMKRVMTAIDEYLRAPHSARGVS